MSSAVPDRYKLFNSQQTKRLSIVLKIDGVPDVLTSAPLGTRIKYGDPGLIYGLPGMVYGGLRPYINADGSTFKNLLSLQGSSLALSQQLQSEVGKSSISNISLAFVDQDGYITSLFTPGVVVDEIMGRDAVLYVGYAETSYPDDYLPIFRGIITSVDVAGGLGTIQVSDPNVKRKQEVFFVGKGTLENDLTDVATSVNILTEPRLVPHSAVQLPDLSYDPTVSFYFQIDNEWIGSSWISPSSTATLTRGALGTVAAAHTAGAQINAAIKVDGFAIDLALKVMLSGSANGISWINNVPVYSIGDYPDTTPLLTMSRKIILPGGVDAVRDYGLVAGDWLYVSGSANTSDPHQIISIDDMGTDLNRVLTVDFDLIKDMPSGGPIGATLSFRSQYDVLPEGCGLGLKPTEVDIEQHLFLRDTFQSVALMQYSFFLTSAQSSGKDFIETEIYLPAGMFSVTRRGLLSVGLSKPPIADQELVILSEDNVIDPQNIRPSRSINGRNFYNDVDFSYDPDDQGNFQQIYRVIDTDSLNQIGIFSPLAIDSQGMRAATTDTATLDRIAAFLLSRFKRGMVTFPISVQWGDGNLIEAGDTIAVKDGGSLKIPNFFTPERNFGTRLFEVISRNLDIPNGKVDLIVGAGVGADFTDRFATISPSSVVDVGSTASRVVIMDSYGAIYPGNEKKKWEQYFGELVLFHSDDWSYQEETTLTGFDPSFPYIVIVDPPLSGAPSAGYIMDIPNYPASNDPLEQSIYKQVHVHLDATIPIVSGTSPSVFTVSTANSFQFIVGRKIRIHDDDYTNDSGDVAIAAIDPATGIVTLTLDLLFTPDNTMRVELGSFDDQGGAYRWI